MGSSFIVSMSAAKSIASLTGDFFLINNRSGTKTLRLNEVKVTHSCGLVAAIVTCYVKYNVSVSSLANASSVSVLSPTVGQTAVSLTGAQFYEWNSSGAGMTGITSGNVVDGFAGSIGTTDHYVCGGLILPPGTALSISVNVDQGTGQAFIVAKGSVY